MKLMTLNELVAAPRPSASQVRAWQQDPCTDLLLNSLFHVLDGSGIQDSTRRLGFLECRDAVMRLLTDAEAQFAPADQAPAPEPDYGSEAYLEARRQQLGLSPKPQNRPV